MIKIYCFLTTNSGWLKKQYATAYKKMKMYEIMYYTVITLTEL